MRRLTRLALTLAALTLADTALADVQPMVGLYYLRDQLGTSTSGLGQQRLNSNGGLGILFGLGGAGDNRISLDFTAFDLGNDSSLNLYNINVDHFFVLPNTDPNLRVFAGGALGFGTLDIKAANGVSGDKARNADFGIRLGAEYRFTPQISGEIGARYLWTNLTTHLSDAYGPFKFSINDDLGGWVGVNYRF